MATLAVLTFVYYVVVVAITHVADDRMSASSRVPAWLTRIAGRMLAAFGVKLALGKWRYFTERWNLVPRISSSSGPASVALMRSSPIVIVTWLPLVV